MKTRAQKHDRCINRPGGGGAQQRANCYCLSLLAIFFFLHFMGPWALLKFCGDMKIYKITQSENSFSVRFLQLLETRWTLFVHPKPPFTCEPQTTVSCREDTDGVGVLLKLQPGQVLEYTDEKKKHRSVSRLRVYILYWAYLMECFLEHLCVFSALNSTTLTLPYPNNENHIIHSSDKPDYNVTQNLLLILHGSTFFLCFFLFFFFEITSYLAGRGGGLWVGRGREGWFV